MFFIMILDFQTTLLITMANQTCIDGAHKHRMEEFAGRIDSTFLQQDMFFATNITAILFYPPNKPPSSPMTIELIHSKSKNVTNMAQKHEVPQGALDDSPSAAMQLHLNVTDALALVPERYTEDRLIVQEGFAVGIFYAYGYAPTRIILSTIPEGDSSFPNPHSSSKLHSTSISQARPSTSNPSSTVIIPAQVALKKTVTTTVFTTVMRPLSDLGLASRPMVAESSVTSSISAAVPTQLPLFSRASLDSSTIQPPSLSPLPARTTVVVVTPPPVIVQSTTLKTLVKGESASFFLVQSTTRSTTTLPIIVKSTKLITVTPPPPPQSTVFITAIPPNHDPGKVLKRIPPNKRIQTLNKSVAEIITASSLTVSAVDQGLIDTVYPPHDPGTLGTIWGAIIGVVAFLCLSFFTLKWCLTRKNANSSSTQTEKHDPVKIYRGLNQYITPYRMPVDENELRPVIERQLAVPIWSASTVAPTPSIVSPKATGVDYEGKSLKPRIITPKRPRSLTPKIQNPFEDPPNPQISPTSLTIINETDWTRLRGAIKKGELDETKANDIRNLMIRQPGLALLEERSTARERRNALAILEGRDEDVLKDDVYNEEKHIRYSTTGPHPLSVPTPAPFVAMRDTLKMMKYGAKK
jgi:hypothetical protein